MIEAYRDGFPANGTAVPDGAAMAKIEWLKARNDRGRNGVTVSGAQTEASFMLNRSAFRTPTGGDTPRLNTTVNQRHSSRPSQPLRRTHAACATGATS